jgi:hypothetical protein
MGVRRAGRILVADMPVMPHSHIAREQRPVRNVSVAVDLLL